MSNRHVFLQLVIACLLAWNANDASAQVDRGFTQIVPSTATGIELNRQRDLWVMEVQYKRVRIVWVEFTDPATGETVTEPVWYLAYRVLPRPLPTIDDSATRPQNELDQRLGPSLFIPEFTLMTYENRNPDDQDREIPIQTLMDQVIPEALPVINEIERPRNVESYPQFVDSVSLVQEVPEPVAADAEDQPWIYGVATWRGVDPDTDFFKIQMLGFSNGYDLIGDEVNPRPWRKAIEQRFTRLGDEFDLTLREFAFDGEPQWLYIPDEGTAAAAQ